MGPIQPTNNSNFSSPVNFRNQSLEQNLSGPKSTGNAAASPYGTSKLGALPGILGKTRLNASQAVFAALNGNNAG